MSREPQEIDVLHQGRERVICCLRAGDVLSARHTVLSTKASQSRPDRGFVRFRFEVLDASSGYFLLADAAPAGRSAAR